MPRPSARGSGRLMKNLGGAYVPQYGMCAPLRDRCDRIHAKKRHVCATRVMTLSYRQEKLF
jgi:hypothetical protein